MVVLDSMLSIMDTNPTIKQFSSLSRTASLPKVFSSKDYNFKGLELHRVSLIVVINILNSFIIMNAMKRKSNPKYSIWKKTVQNNQHDGQLLKNVRQLVSRSLCFSENR